MPRTIHQSACGPFRATEETQIEIIKTQMITLSSRYRLAPASIRIFVMEVSESRQDSIRAVTPSYKVNTHILIQVKFTIVLLPFQVCSIASDVNRYTLS